MYKNPQYDLKYQYRRVLELSAITSLLLLIGLFVRYKQFEHHVQVKALDVPLLEVQDVVVTQQIKRVLKPDKPAILIPDFEIDIEDLIPFTDTDEIYNITLTAPHPPPTEDPILYMFVEQKPTLIGGNSAITNYIIKHELFPKTARGAGICGEVIIEFGIDKNGVTRDVCVVQESPENLGFGFAGVKVMQAMRFTPGMQNDRYVTVKMQQPIKFDIR
jgi:TonB family protein